MRKDLICLPLFALLTFACGPRSGIHNNDSENTNQEENRGFCGNADLEGVNTNWVSSVCGISGDGQRGYKLFKQNCAVCHTLSDQKLTGSGLKGISERVPEPKITWLKNYILNSEKVYKSHDRYAKKLHKQANGAVMTNFEDYLSDKDLNDLLVYVLANTR